MLDLVLLAGPLALFAALWVALVVRRRGGERRVGRASVPASSPARLVFSAALALGVVLVGIGIGEAGFVALGAAAAAIQLVFLTLLVAVRRLDRTESD